MKLAGMGLLLLIILAGFASASTETATFSMY